MQIVVETERLDINKEVNKMKLSAKEKLAILKEVKRRGGISDVYSDPYYRVMTQLQSEQIRPKVIPSKVLKLRKITNVMSEIISYAVIFFVLWYLPVKCVTGIWHFIRRRMRHE